MQEYHGTRLWSLLYFTKVQGTLMDLHAGWDFIWQCGSAADRNFLELNRNIGRKSRVFVAFGIGIRKSFLIDRNKSFQEEKTKNANRNLFSILFLTEINSSQRK